MSISRFVDPAIASSFKPNKLGESIFSAILLFRPKRVIELGALGGYSSVCILQALSQLRQCAHLTSYDLFELYPYNNVSLDDYKLNIAQHEHLIDSSIVTHTIVQADIMDTIASILSTPENSVSEKTIVFVDISNTAENLLRIFDSNVHGFPVLFEGGTSDRDNVQWMTRYRKKPIHELKALGFNYSIIDHSFPGLSLYHPLLETNVYT